MAAGADLPHDLSTFVIERELRLEHGFWGCVADGATFRSLGRRRTPQGRTVIQRNLVDLDRAEEQVNAIFFAWRAGGPTVADQALDSMLEQWRALGDGDELVLEWPRPARRRAGQRQR